MSKQRLITLLTCLFLLAACSKENSREKVHPVAPPAEIPAAKSERFGRLVWQEDGTYAYAMLRPIHWKTIDNNARTYLPPDVSDPAEFSIIAQNLQIFEKIGIKNVYVEPLALYRQNPSLKDWTQAMEYSWQQTGAMANIEHIQSLDQAEVYAIHAAGGMLRLTALAVDQDQPMIVTLDIQGDLADLNRLRAEGILEDFFTIVNSIRAIPYQPGIVNPAMQE